MLVDSSQGWLPLLPLEPQPGSDGELEPSHHSAWGGSPLPGTSCSIEALRESLHAVTPSASTLGATSPSAWSIRPARTGDLPAIKAIHVSESRRATSGRPGWRRKPQLRTNTKPLTVAARTSAGRLLAHRLPGKSAAPSCPRPGLHASGGAATLVGKNPGCRPHANRLAKLPGTSPEPVCRFSAPTIR